MQYYIKVSITEYKKRIEYRTWKFPKYKDKFGHGYYYRTVVTLSGEIIKIPIKRYKKIKPGKNPTESLLPSQLIPYSKYELTLVTKVTSTWKKFKGNIKKTLDKITTGDVCNKIYDIGVSHLYYFSDIFELARRKYIIWQKTNLYYSLATFVRYCSKNRYCYAGILNNKYYYSNGGYQANSQFLFGKASQFRNTKK